LFKSFIRLLILFIFKKDSSFKLCINYYSFNKVIVKNYYLLFFILKILNRIFKIKCFFKINFKKTYYYVKIKESN
ncbi:hypothetical protein M434DRAFT_87191, partial [Hypoxylon sp. CO27-5]